MSYVTREELDAHLTPMRSDIGEIKRDVKTLLGADAGSRAVSTWTRFWLGTFALAAIGVASSSLALLIH